MHYFLKKLRTDPLGLIKNIFSKLFIFRVKYGKGSGYDARKYWSDRFTKHGPASLKAVGDEGLTEEENLKAREDALVVFNKISEEEAIDLARSRICEIGCGSGFYTNHVYKSGTKNYTGIDITDTFFPHLRDQYPSYHFISKDITVDPLEGTFDVVIMIDVIQHIVSKQKASWAMDNIKQCLPVNGVLLLAPLRQKGGRQLWHVHTWSFDDIKRWFGSEYSKRQVLLRDNEYLYVIRKTEKTLPKS